MKKVLVIDNYDSFTFNLVHYVEACGAEAIVWRNDSFELSEVAQFEKILLSPGPGIPEEAGLLKAVITEYAISKSILGICLGQQAIAEVFGGKLTNLPHVYHGVASEITILTDDEILFRSLPKTLTVGRYHSWSVDKTLPDVLETTSIDANGEIMSLRHKTLDVRAVQFHPESVLTPNGMTIIRNWINS
ncbi:MAG: aminodeoxychorismate/anthranilate synthase component II [Flavobacterium sp.]|nr:MAG: aminodeoxychorismate/anthranilate synthase component II [Flavobacterium sp.]